MNRWKTILGRGGTTLIAISLALLLVSIVPQPQFSRTEGSMHLSPEQVRIISSQQDLTPQQELEITVTVEGPIKIYLLEMIDQVQFVRFGEVEFNFTDIQESMKQQEMLVLEILDEQPDKIIWEREVHNGYSSRNYSPTRVINATLVLYNPSSETANVEYSVSLKSSLAPGDKVRNIAYWAAPIGIILALPWLLNLRKQRKHK